MTVQQNFRNVPFFNYPALFSAQEKEIMSVLQDVMRRGAYIMQKDLSEFERNLAAFLNVKHAFGVANGTDALVIALKACGIGPGHEVIVPSHTFVASVSSVALVGAKPVLVDCARDHLIDSKAIESAITKKTRAIMPVQLNGRTSNMDALQRIALNHDLLIIEDAAQALGSKFKGRHAGTFGLAGTFSFYPAKVLGCYGDGGGVVTNNDQVAQQVFELRDHGRNSDGEIVQWGFNSRLDNLQAALLNLKLKNFEEAITRRRKLATLYREKLKHIPAIDLPPGPDGEDHFDVYQNYEIEADRRDELKIYLEKAGVKTVIQWGGKAVHQFSALGFKIKLPYTERMFKRCLLLPMNTSLSDEDIQYVCDRIESFYN